MPREKIKFALRIKPETQELVREWYPKDNCQSQNEFIENAIHFYVEHLSAQERSRFLPSALVDALQATVKNSENRIARLMFKETVELSMMMHVLAMGLEVNTDQLDQRRDELTEDAEETMAQLVTEMQSGTLENQRIGQLMTELAQRLRNTSGKKQYGYLSPPLKSLVDEIVDELEQDPRISTAYDLWYREREEVLRTYKDDLPERIPLSRQKEFRRIKNIIIGEAAKLGEVAQEVEVAHTGNSADGADGDTGQSKSEPPPTPPSRSKPTVLPGQVARSAASLLYQVGRIFEGQHPRPAAGPRVEVDSKLKRKIREKKIAMGHKPDDHEEQGQTM